MLVQLLPMILIVLIGLNLRRTGLIQPSETKTIGKLLTHLALPAIILKALLTVSLTPDLIYLPLSALVVVIGLTLIGWLGSGWLKGGRATRGAFITAFPTFEGGAVGYPLMLLSFGELGLSRLVLFDLAQALYLLTVVYGLSAWYGQNEVTGQVVIQKLTRTPFFWAILLGLGGNALGLSNDLLINLLDLIGGSFLPLVLLLLGLEFQMQMASVGFYSLLALAKIGCGLGLGWLVASAFGLTGAELAAVLLGAALPPSLLTLLFAQENQLDTGFTISLISIAIPLYGLVMTPLLRMLAN
ncbi:MAG: hypothetical protein HC922_08635 [Leptolyngbyaceae cyanobacterium SM2_3_12]|nr:hypothetical protein [Leptolyngbyaceae cyanobacterium SM2_3_12]